MAIAPVREKNVRSKGTSVDVCSSTYAKPDMRSGMFHDDLESLVVYSHIWHMFHASLPQLLPLPGFTVLMVVWTSSVV